MNKPNDTLRCLKVLNICKSCGLVGQQTMECTYNEKLNEYFIRTHSMKLTPYVEEMLKSNRLQISLVHVECIPFVIFLKSLTH